MNLRIGLNGQEALEIAQTASSGSELADMLDELYGKAIWLGGGAMTSFVGPNFGVAAYANGNVGIGAPQPSAKLSIQTPDRYSGSTFRVEAKEEPGKYYLNLDAGTERDIVKRVFNQRNADTNFPYVLAFDRGNVGIGTAGPLARLSVNGNSSQDGTAVFTPDSAKGTQSSHIHRDATGDWYIRSASTAGKVVIQDGGSRKMKTCWRSILRMAPTRAWHRYTRHSKKRYAKAT